VPKIKCHIVILADRIHDDTEEQACEFLEEAILDTGYIVAANQHWDYTEVHYISGHTFVIDLDFNDFCKKWTK
jgi:hypothetical protein